MKSNYMYEQGKVDVIYHIHRMTVDMEKGKVAIKTTMKKLVRQFSAGGYSTGVGRKTVSNYGGKLPTSKYISNIKNNLLRDFYYTERQVIYSGS